MTDIEPYQPLGIDRFTTHGRSVVKRVREVEGRAIVRARAADLDEQIEVMRAEQRIINSGRLLRTATQAITQGDAYITALSEGKPGVELACRNIESIVQMGIADVIANYMTRR